MSNTKVTNVEMFNEGKKFELDGDLKKAIECYKLAANNGNYKASGYLGMLYDNGIFVDKNIDQAIIWFKQIYENFGDIIEELEDLDEDIDEDFDVEEEISYYSDCIFSLAAIYESLNNIDEAIKCYKLLIEYNPSRESLCSLANIYYENGNYEEAFKYYIEAGEDYYFSDFKLAELYFYYYKDYKTALNWYEKAASIGVEEATIKIGEIYYYGLGVEQNYSEAFSCLMYFDLEKLDLYDFEDFCEYDFPKANYLLGLMFINGYGTPKNTVLGEMLLEAAKKAGYKE